MDEQTHNHKEKKIIIVKERKKERIIVVNLLGEGGLMASKSKFVGIFRTPIYSPLFHFFSDFLLSIPTTMGLD